MFVFRSAVIATIVLLSGYPAANGQDIEFVESVPVGTMLDNADIRDAKDVWVAMIDRAERSLEMEQFYVSTAPGGALEPVLDAVRRAGARGVRVRLLVDARMYRTYPEAVDAVGKMVNGEARRIDFSKIAGGIQHAKYFIVDGREVFVGSQNFDWRALEHIHELGLRVKDATVARAYLRIFDHDWHRAGGGEDRLDGGDRLSPVPCAVGPGDTAIVQPTSSPWGWIPDSTLWDERMILELIDGARTGVVMQFLAYGTHDRKGGEYTAIDDAIRRAAGRGVKVRMIVADWEKGGSSEAALKSLSRERNIEVAFSAIPAWEGGYIPFARVEHCKYLVADGERFWLGTSNCEKGYFYGSRNMGLVVTSRTMAKRLVQIFAKSWESPYRESIVDGRVYAPRQHGERAP